MRSCRTGEWDGSAGRSLRRLNVAAASIGKEAKAQLREESTRAPPPARARRARVRLPRRCRRSGAREKEERGRTLSLEAVLGSRTRLTSLVNCETVPPTVPLWTTNDLGVFCAPAAPGAAGAALGAGLICKQGEGRISTRCGGAGRRASGGSWLRSRERERERGRTWVRVLRRLDPLRGMAGASVEGG